MIAFFITTEDDNGTRLWPFPTEEARDAFALAWCAERWETQWGDMPDNWPEAHEKVSLWSQDCLYCHDDISLDDHPAVVALRGALDQIEALLGRDDVTICSEAGVTIENALKEIDLAFGREKALEAEHV